MTPRQTPDHPPPPLPHDPQEQWKLVDDPQRGPLRGGRRDTSRMLAIITMMIAILAITVALTILVLPI